MPLEYNIGPNDEPIETNSGLVLLPSNNTLIAMPFKGENGPRQPEELPKDAIKSTKDVMEYAQPEVKVKIKTGNDSNPEVTETVRYQGGVESFSPKNIKKKSVWLRRLDAELQASETLVDRIDKNPQFRKALDDPQTRSAIIAAFQQIVDDLKQSLPTDHVE